MNDKEYVEFLEAVAAEYLEEERGVVPPYRNTLYFSDSISSLNDLASTALLARTVGEKQGGQELLRRALGSELKRSDWKYLKGTLAETGVTEALDQHGEALLGNFRRSVVPEADLEILRQAGIEHPEAALRIAEERARVFARRAANRDFWASNVLQLAGQELETAGAQLDPPEGTESEGTKYMPRKWFKGISRILAGGAGCFGNVLIGAGVIPVAAPIGAAAVLGSCTGSIVLIGDGIEALRGID